MFFLLWAVYIHTPPTLSTWPTIEAPSPSLQFSCQSLHSKQKIRCNFLPFKRADPTFWMLHDGSRMSPCTLWHWTHCCTSHHDKICRFKMWSFSTPMPLFLLYHVHISKPFGSFWQKLSVQCKWVWWIAFILWYIYNYKWKNSNVIRLLVFFFVWIAWMILHQSIKNRCILLLDTTVIYHASEIYVLLQQYLFIGGGLMSIA